MEDDLNSHRKDSILFETIMDLMPQFVLHVDPIVHRANFRGMRINDNQVKVIMLLHHAGKVSPGFITHHLNIQKGSLTGVLRSLRKKNLIKRDKVSGDERSYRVSLTAAGGDFVSHHMAECERRMGFLLGDMEDEQRHDVKRGLESLTRYLKTRGDADARS